MCEEDAGTAGILMVSSDIPRDYFPPCTVTLDFFRTFHRDLLFLLLSYFHKFSNILQLLGIIFPPCTHIANVIVIVIANVIGFVSITRSPKITKSPKINPSDIKGIFQQQSTLLQSS